MTTILAKDIGKMLFDMLKEAVAEEFPEASEAERDESIARILTALSKAPLTAKTNTFKHVEV